MSRNDVRVLLSVEAEDGEREVSCVQRMPRRVPELPSAVTKVLVGKRGVLKLRPRITQDLLEKVRPVAYQDDAEE